jgi:hypothetical protein
MGKRDTAIAIFAAIVLLLSACSPHATKAYQGQELPGNQTALLQSGPHTEIISLDGHRVASQTVSVLPGHHTITMRILENRPPMSPAYAFYSLSDASVDFIAQPGRRYVASVDVVGSPFPVSGEKDSGFRLVGNVRDMTANQVIAQTDYLPVGAWPRVPHSLRGS